MPRAKKARVGDLIRVVGGPHVHPHWHGRFGIRVKRIPNLSKGEIEVRICDDRTPGNLFLDEGEYRVVLRSKKARALFRALVKRTDPRRMS